MSKTERIATLITECLDRCRHSGYTLATMIHFLEEMRKEGHSEVDVKQVDFIMRHILKDVIAPSDVEMPIVISESPTGFNASDTIEMDKK